MSETSKESLPLVESQKLHAELKRLLGSLRRLTVEHVASAAEIFCILEERGEDVSYVSREDAAMFRAVVQGGLEPEVVLAFGGSKRRLRVIRGLPKKDRLHLALGKPVEVVEKRGDAFVTKPVPGNCLRQAELRRVIVDGKLLSTFEQKARLKAEGAEVSTAATGSRRVTMTLEGALYESLLAEADRRQVSIPTLIADLLSWAVQGLDLGRKEKRRAPAVEKGAESA